MLNLLVLSIAINRNLGEVKHSKEFRALMGPRARIAK
jgi:hypothetical protein